MLPTCTNNFFNIWNMNWFVVFVNLFEIGLWVLWFSVAIEWVDLGKRFFVSFSGPTRYAKQTYNNKPQRKSCNLIVKPILHDSDLFNRIFCCTTFSDTGWLVCRRNFEFFFLCRGPPSYARKVYTKKKSKNRTQSWIKKPLLHVSDPFNPSCWRIAFLDTIGWLLSCRNFDIFCFQNLQDMLQRCCNKGLL